MSTRCRGLVSLSLDAVRGTTSIVENVHRGAARRPFAILEQIPVVDGPAAIVETVHDAVLSTVYGTIRVVTSGVDSALTYTMNELERAQQKKSA